MKPEKRFSVGFSRVDITPEESVPLAGYGNAMDRLSRGALDPLYATCIAFTDSEDRSVLLYTVDLGNSADVFCSPARDAVSQKHDLPRAHVIISATHTHSAPDFSQQSYPPLARYTAQLTKKLTEAADLAMADRAPAGMLAGQTCIDGMNFVRHYILEDDTCAGDNFGDFARAPIRCHAGEADRQLQLVRLCREGAKDILLVNWQAHPTKASTGMTEHGKQNRPYISADFIGSCRSYVEEKADVCFAYFQGACGNINPHSRIKEEDPVSEHIPYGQQLGGHILAALDRLKPIQGGKAAACEATHRSPVNHSENHLLPQAKAIFQHWQQTKDAAACRTLGQPHGIHSAYHAGAIVRKAALSGELQLCLGAGHVGDFAFAVLPYEVFAVNGCHIKQNAPFAMTFILECANGAESYLPSEDSFQHGCYEADQCHYEPGTAEKAAELALQLFQQLHQTP